LPEAVAEAAAQPIPRDGKACVRIELRAPVPLPLLPEVIGVGASRYKSRNAIQHGKLMGFPAPQVTVMREHRAAIVRTPPCDALSRNALKRFLNMWLFGTQLCHAGDQVLSRGPEAYPLPPHVVLRRGNPHVWGG